MLKTLKTRPRRATRKEVTAACNRNRTWIQLEAPVKALHAAYLLKKMLLVHHKIWVIRNFSARPHDTDLCQNPGVQDLREASPDAANEERLEEELQTSKEKYLLASETLYEPPEDAQNVIEAAIKVNESNRFQRLTNFTVRKHVLNLFNGAHEEAHGGTSSSRANCS